MEKGSIIVRGVVLDVQLREGTTTKGQPYRFHIVSVLTGKQVSEVRWPESDDLGVLPKDGDVLEVAVSLDVFNGRQQIEAERRISQAGARVAAAS